MAGGGLSDRRGPAYSQDPWRNSPVSELHDPVLPRWFVLTALAMVPIALIVTVIALTRSDGVEALPVAALRPPPTQELTTGVGDYAIGEGEPQPLPAPCPRLEGVRIAGSDAERAVLGRGLAPLCAADLDAAARSALRDFADRGGAVRFAQFADTGVDTTALRDQALILINTRFSRSEPAWIAPLVVYDLVILAGDPAGAETVLDARRAEAALCAALFAGDNTPGPSRACRDAHALVDLPDPLAALRQAGFSG